MINIILNSLTKYIEESLSLMKDISIELKEIKELLQTHHSWHVRNEK